MPRMQLILDGDACTGCFACEVACKQEHGLPAGPKILRIRGRAEPAGGRLRLRYDMTVCHHCDDAPCAGVCPTEALVRDDDGLVLVRPEDCIGCMECLDVCQYGVPELNPDSGAIVLCDQCRERTARGARPSCEHHCHAGAIRLVEAG